MPERKDGYPRKKGTLSATPGQIDTAIAVKATIVKPKQGDHIPLWNGILHLRLLGGQMVEAEDGTYTEIRHTIGVERCSTYIRLRMYGEYKPDKMMMFGSATVYYKRRSAIIDDLMLCIDVQPTDQMIGRRLEITSHGFRTDDETYTCFRIHGSIDHFLAIAPLPEAALDLVERDVVTDQPAEQLAA